MLNAALVCFAVLISSNGTSASPLAQRTRKAMDPTDKLVQEKFTAFEKDHDPAFVYHALDAVEAAQRDTSPGDTAVRKRALSLSLSFLTALDRNIDPKWDPEIDPVRGVPPPISGVPVLGTGEIDPAAIPDPAVRARYEQELKARRDYLKYCTVQFQLRRIDDRATASIGRFVERCYTSSPADRSEFEELLAAAPLSAARKHLLRKLKPRTRLWRFK